MRKRIFMLVFMVVLLGLFEGVSPVFAMPEELSARLDDDIFGNRVGSIVIDSVHARYTALANVGEQNAKQYYELKAYHPSAIPMTITWGMVQAAPDGYLRFSGNFDSTTLVWIRNYGLSGASYSVRPL